MGSIAIAKPADQRETIALAYYDGLTYREIATRLRESSSIIKTRLRVGLFKLAVPRILGFLLIVLIGWFIASLIARVVAGLLRTVKFNDLAKRAGISEFVRNTGLQNRSGNISVRGLRPAAETNSVAGRSSYRRMSRIL